MHPRLQLGIRENPASSRRHGSHLGVSTQLNERKVEKEKQLPSVCNHRASTSAQRSSRAASPRTDIAGEEIHQSGLLTVHEVAELLQVPVSWVYGRTRRRSTERLPGYRLGKYWRFREVDVLSWLDVGEILDSNHAELGNFRKGMNFRLAERVAPVTFPIIRPLTFGEEGSLFGF